MAESGRFGPASFARLHANLAVIVREWERRAALLSWSAQLVDALRFAFREHIPAAERT